MTNELKRPHGWREIEKTFGKIIFEEAKGGYVQIVNDWERKNTSIVLLPIVGKHRVHILMNALFQDIFADIYRYGYGGLLHEFGCYCPRHKMHNPRRGLSTHSWAIACDINQSENPPGIVGKMDPRIVEIFESHGFVWGGRWPKINLDWMHFQFATGY